MTISRVVHVGQRVTFKTSGRYPVVQSGTIASIDPSNPQMGWCEIDCDDGSCRKARPASLTPDKSR